MYRHGDAEKVRAKSLYKDDVGLLSRIESICDDDQSLIVTFVVDDKPVAVIGWSLLVDGSLEWWGLTSDDVSKFPKYFAQSVRKIGNKIVNEVKPKSNYLLIYSHDDAGVSIRSAEFLGFRRRGYIKNLKVTGLDYWLYERAS